jgi:energy-coupling factor transporter ATP-binding protein EcfA2
MLTKLTMKNFKRFKKVEIELGNPVVFIGPNNSGKTSVLQALALWDIGIKKWFERRFGKKSPEKRPGVTINRRDLVAVPVPSANLLWRDLHVRSVKRSNGKQQTSNIRIDIIVEGITEDKAWKCGLEFDYANEESFYCRPLRKKEGRKPPRMTVPDEAGKIQIAFLPPMSGLAANETRLDTGSINVRIGEGRTAEVLRNLCYQLYEKNRGMWENLGNQIRSLFGVDLLPPRYIPVRGEIEMSYLEDGVTLDLSSSGRGLQQTLLLLSYMYANPGAVLLLDEPDAHLEIPRQRQIYQLLTDVAQESGSQIMAASHSEVVLNEAADRDLVIAFVGKPHRIDDRGSQILKALREIGFEQYYQAEQTGWVLYLEGSTDLAILRAFAERLNYEDAISVLARPFVCYVGNQPGKVRDHFFGLREAVPDLQGIAIFDRLDRDLPDDLGAEGKMWTRREIESYLCSKETLIGYAEASAEPSELGPLFTSAERENRRKAMEEAIHEVEQALETLGKGSPWDTGFKVSDDFLTPIFEKYFKKLRLTNLMKKKNFYELVNFVPRDQIDAEIKEKLDAIVGVAMKARPRQ